MISLCQNYPMQVKEEFLAFKVILVSSCRSVDVKGHKPGSSRGRGGLCCEIFVWLKLPVKMDADGELQRCLNNPSGKLKVPYFASH